MPRKVARRVVIKGMASKRCRTRFAFDTCRDELTKRVLANECQRYREKFEKEIAERAAKRRKKREYDKYL